MAQSVELTPHQRQYLCKILAQLQMSREWSAVGDVGCLATYGSPFLAQLTIPNRKLAKQSWPDPRGSWVLKFMFYYFLITFPGLSSAPKKYWTKVVQPCFDDVSSRNLSDSIERSETTKRRTLAIIFTQYFGTIFFSGLPCIGERAPIRAPQAIYDKIEQLYPPPQTEAIAGFYVFIPKVDVATHKQTNRKTAQYLIITREEGKEDVCVYRDYPTFRKFDDDIAKEAGVTKPALPPAGSDGIASRVALQSYIRALLPILQRGNTGSTSSMAFKIKSFLMGFPLTLPPTKLTDLQERVVTEEEHLEKTHTLWVTYCRKADASRDGWHWWSRFLLTDTGLDESFEILRTHPSMYDLPPQYKRVAEWVRAYVAYLLHHYLVVAPNAVELFYILQVCHHLFPYGIVRQLLKIANPAHMIKALVTFLLKSPPGTKSVFSRIFSYMAGREVKQFSNEIIRVEKLVGDENACAILKQFVKAPRGEQDAIRERARANDVDIVVTILTGPSSTLSADEAAGIIRCHKEFVEGVKSGDSALLSDKDEKSQTGPRADKFKLLKRLLRLYALKRGRKLSTDLWSPSVESFLVSSLELFLPGLSAVSQVSNLSDRLGDLKRFIDDVCEVVLTSKRTTTDFHQVSERHEQSLWYLFHEMHSGDPHLMDPVVAFFRKGLVFMDRGFSAPDIQRPDIVVDLDKILASRPDITSKVIEEINTVTKFVMYSKLRFELRLRQDSLGSRMKVDADALLQQIMESEGDGDMILGGGGNGVPNAGYFYDGQAVDNATVISMRGETYSAPDSKFTLEDADSGSVTDNFSVTNTLPKTSRAYRGEFSLKAPLLTETRKLVPAYLEQIGTSLLELAAKNAWKNPKAKH